MKIEKYFTLIDRTMVTIDGVGHVFQTIKYQVFCVVRLRVLFKITFIILRRFRGFFLNMWNKSYAPSVIRVTAW